MANRLPIGPYRTVTGPCGDIPWYIVPFDKAGRCTGPRTAQEAIKRVRSGQFTDVVLFSHGWNNDWGQATERYENFVAGYLAQLKQHPPETGFRKALLIGIFWPSKLLVGPEQTAPVIAGDGPSDAAVADEREDVTELAELLTSNTADRFYELTQRDKVTSQEAQELAEMFLPWLGKDDAETGEQAPPRAADVVKAWAATGTTQLTPVADLGDTGFESPALTSSQPEAALDLGFLDPREIVRYASVWRMKDRAGVVGARGVSRLLSDIAAADVRVHLVGHSFGGKVMLSALCTPETLPQVRSLLLLQPAVSHQCFAQSVNGTGQQGGYRQALRRVKLPILSTFSSNDVPLRKFFHHALRRQNDLTEGEPEIAGESGNPPNRFAALGGFGPRPLDGQIQLTEILDPGNPYNLGAGSPEIYGVNASRAILGHGDVSKSSTWWMLSQLVHQG